MDSRAAELLARQLMTEHGLIAEGWQFRWDRAKQRFGRCSYRGHFLSLSLPLVQLNSEEEVRDTILHEISHALVGPNHGHGLTWQHKARIIGARPSRCCSKQAVLPPSRYIGKCVDCGVEAKYYKLSRIVRSQKAYHTKCRRRGKTGKVDWFLVAGDKLIPMRVVEMERQ